MDCPVQCHGRICELFGSLTGEPMPRVAPYLATILMFASAGSAQQVGSDDSTFESGILVTGSDVTSCPYRLVQPVTINVTEDYGADTRAKIFQKLRNEAVRLGADAVVLVTKGGTHMTAWAWNRREYSGRAIRYVDRQCAPKQ
jgi:uncharacterized protein YbjQ (UPF0145 family)